MKSKTFNVFKVLGVLVVTGLLIFGILMLVLKDNNPVNLDLVLKQTGEAIEVNNRKLVNTYNNYVDSQTSSEEGGEVSVKSSIYTGEQTFEGALYNLNYWQGFYVYSEYFNEFLDGSFLNKTFSLNQTMYQYHNYNVKFTLNSDNIRLEVFDNYADASNNQHREYYDIKVSFNTSTFKPTTLTVNVVTDYPVSVDRNYGDEYTNIVIDYEKATFVMTEIEFDPSISYSELENADDEFYVENLKSVRRFEIDYNDISKYVGLEVYDLTPSDIYALPEETIMQGLEWIEGMSYVDIEDAKTHFDFDNAVVYEDGNKAITYAFNKYIIEVVSDKSDSTNKKYLVTRQAHGIDSHIMSVLNDFVSISNGTFELNDFDDVDYMYNGRNYRRDIGAGFSGVSEQTIEKILNWFDNSYDSNKYYFETIVFDNVKIRIQNSEVCILIENDGEIEFLEAEMWSNTKEISYYKLNSQGSKMFNYQNRVYDTTVYASYCLESNLTYEDFFTNVYGRDLDYIYYGDGYSADWGYELASFKGHYISTWFCKQESGLNTYSMSEVNNLDSSNVTNIHFQNYGNADFTDWGETNIDLIFYIYQLDNNLPAFGI